MLPVPALCLGAAVFALGVAPRAVAAAGALPAVGGSPLYVIADSIHAPGWVDMLSPFAYLAAVPAQPPDWAGTIGQAALAAGLLAAVLMVAAVPSSI